MKKLLILITLISSFLAPSCLLVAQASAVPLSTGCGSGSVNGTPVVCKQLNSGTSSGNPIINVIKDVIDILSFIVGVASVIAIIVAGLRMVLAGGDAQAAASARTGILYALVGVAVVVLAQSIVVFVLNKLQ